MVLEQAVTQTSDGPSSNPTGMLAFLRLAELWQLTTDEQIILLGSPGRSTFFKWKKYMVSDDSLPRDTLERISHLLAIHKALQILLPSDAASDGWIKLQNSYFDGQTALDEMLSGNVGDIYRVRQYLDAQRG